MSQKQFGETAEPSVSSALNAYWCHLPGRTTGMCYDPPDPGEYGVPCGVYIAETRGQAKLMLLADHERETDHDEFPDIRTNLLERDVTDALRGPLVASRVERDWEGENDPPPGPYYRLWERAAAIPALTRTALPSPNSEVSS